MKLSMGISGDFESLNYILSSLDEPPCEIYFSTRNDTFGSSRHGTHEPDKEELHKIFHVLEEKKINPNIVLNAVCLGNEQFSDEFQHKLDSYLDQISQEGVDTITVSDPFLIKYVLKQHPHMNVVVSTTAEVRTPNNVEYYNDLGVERIILSADVNRDLKKIEHFVKMGDAKIELLLNEGCLLYCPWKQSHHKYNAHKTRTKDKKKKSVERYVDICARICLEDDSQIIRSPFIRPEDISVYESIGIEYFKISGRNMPPDWIVKVTQAYQQRSYERNIVDLLNSKEFLRKRINIPNKSLRVL